MKWKKEKDSWWGLAAAAGGRSPADMPSRAPFLSFFFQSDPGLVVVGAWNFFFLGSDGSLIHAGGVFWPQAQHLRLKRFWGPRAKRSSVLFTPSSLCCVSL